MPTMTPLIPIQVASIYDDKPLPTRMAVCTPDTASALSGIVDDLRGLGHDLRLSDMFRTYAMQKQANDDYVNHRKAAFSPPPGGSMHEAGRAMDIDLQSIGVPLSQFWEIARGHGFFPIIDTPDASQKESWHFDCRGSHHAVYEYVKTGKAGAHKPYEQMAMSAILAIGVQLDRVAERDVGAQQAALIRLGFDPGPIDGVIGSRTRNALAAAGITNGDDVSAALDALLQERFPAEFAAA